jgi:hypothetical protein
MSKASPLTLAMAAAAAVGVLAAGACSNDTAPIAAPNLDGASFTHVASSASLASSAVCTVAGGDPVNPLVLPAGYRQTVIASEPDYAHLPDMQTVNETGSQAGRFLYQTHEVGGGASISVTDLVTGETRTIAQRADWERFDGIAWTPWGTLIAAEETGPAAFRDPDYPDAVNGLVYEFTLDRRDPTKVVKVAARPAIGARAHEGLRFDPAGNLYGISETNPGYIFRFVPDRRGDLSSGQTSALRIVSATGDRVGEAVWVPLDRDAVRIDAEAAAAAAGATGYNRPEDVEIATSTGSSVDGDWTLYVAVTGRSAPTDNRVLAIDLRQRHGERAHATAFAYDYVAWDVNVDHEFEMPDNLALDRHGNLFIGEDPGGNFRNGTGKTKGDDIWRAAPPRGGKHLPSAKVERFASLNDCDAEPTGIYFAKGSDRLFVNVQHRGGGVADRTMEITRAR